MRKILYQLSDRFTLILFTVAIILIFVMLYYSQKIVHDLRAESRNIIEFYARVHSQAALQDDVTLINFLFEEIIKRTNFPIILTDNQKNPDTWIGIKIDSNDKSDKTVATVKRMIRNMEKQIAPVPITYKDPILGEKILGYLFYGDSNLITRLIWLPYIEISVIGLFIVVAFLGFRSIKKSEEQFIWVGLTKETTHQLGTPLSSLMGWLELIKSKTMLEPDNKVIAEMENDIKRLTKVTARFSQIGTRAGMKRQNLIPILEDAVKYFQRRLPHMGKEVKIIKQFEKIPPVNINSDLFEWVIENLIKNSLDAIEKKKGIIEISTGMLEDNSNNIFMDIKDNGKGILPHNRRKIFKPGFSTKKRGWGLGLNLTKRIVEEFHHGKLFVKDSRQGEGTTMRIVLKG